MNSCFFGKFFCKERLAASRRSQNQMITAVEGDYLFLELVILILSVEGICRVFVERVVAWSRDATIWGMGCVGGGIGY